MSSGRSRDRLTSAYVYGLSGLEPSDFPDDEGRAEFVALCDALSTIGEALEGAGSVPTTAWLLSDDAATTIAARIVALAERYEAR